MVDMTGKVVMVTGATNGIGQAAALELATMGATVVLIGRNSQKLAQTVSDIKRDSGHDNVHSFRADLSVMDEIRTLAATFKQQFDRLDVLLNNAGVILSQRQLSQDGYELTFATNHLNYFLLTHLLLDVLKASAPARIVNVSSDAHRSAAIFDFDNLDGSNAYGMGGFRAYGQSKLANVLFTRELARRLAGSGVTANAVHPGTINTGFGKNNGGMMGLVMRVIGPLLLKSPEEGAKTLVYLASSPEVDGVTGEYFTDCNSVAPSVAAQDDDSAKRLWAISAEMTGLAADGSR